MHNIKKEKIKKIERKKEKKEKKFTEMKKKNYIFSLML